MKEESLLLLSDLQKLINQVVLIDYTIIILGSDYMPENIRNIIYRFSQELRRILGDKLTKIIVYGSYARGDFRENSDIDIMILVKMSDEEIRLVKNDIYDLAFEFEINTGIEFSPIIKNEDQYEYWIDTLPFYRNVRDEGVVIDE